MRKVKIKQLNPFLILTLFVIALSIVVLLVFQIKKVSIANIAGLKPNISDFLSTTSTNKNSKTTVFSQTITETDTCKYAQDYLGSYITNPSCSIINKEVIVKGNINYALGNEGSITMTPKLNNNKLLTEITEFRVGFIDIPIFVKNKMRDIINGSIDNNFNKYALTKSILFSEKQITITFERRN